MKSKIPIKRAEELAKQYDQQAIIIFAVNDDGERFNMTSYGKDSARCKWAGDLADKIAEAILNGKITTQELK